MASLLYTPPGFITVERGFGGECFGVRHLCFAAFEGAKLDFIDHFSTMPDGAFANTHKSNNLHDAPNSPNRDLDFVDGTHAERQS